MGRRDLPQDLAHFVREERHDTDTDSTRDQDKRVPPPNSFELYQGLRDAGVPVKLILYKGFGHPINKPKQQLAVLEHNYEWFSQYIWGEQPGTDMAPAGNN